MADTMNIPLLQPVNRRLVQGLVKTTGAEPISSTSGTSGIETPSFFDRSSSHSRCQTAWCPTIRARLALEAMVQLFLVTMAVAGAKEATVAGSATIRVLKQHIAKEPIFDADSFRTEELFATAVGTLRGLRLRSGFVHGKTLCWGCLCYNI